MLSDSSKVEAAMDACKESSVGGTKYSGMTYEEGVVAALEWVLEFIDDNDFEYSAAKES